MKSFESKVKLVNFSLKILLQAGNDYQHAELAFCVGQISTAGILAISSLIKSSRKVSSVIALDSINKANSFQLLKDLGADVYLYPTLPESLFLSKLYYGTVDTMAWAMVGAANLTSQSLVANTECGLFLTGQRYLEPFVSIESEIEIYRDQSYPFNKELHGLLKNIEKSLTPDKGVLDYYTKLRDAGIIRKNNTALAISKETQQQAISDFFNFIKITRLEGVPNNTDLLI